MLYLHPLAAGLASLILLGASYGASLTSSSTNILSMLPSQPAGESLGTFLDRLFSDETGSFPTNTSVNGSSSKRGLDSVDTATVDIPTTSPYTNAYGLHQSCWDEDTGSGTVKYNISADFSSCSTGLTLGTDIGVYTFTNGTTTNSTQLRDMVYDLYTLRHSRKTPNPNYANHTAAVARLAFEEGNRLLESGLICRNDSTPTQTDLIIHQELRHLLANKHSYWAAVLLSATGGAILSGSIAAIVDKVSSGNVTGHNVIQTALVVGSVVIIGGILTRLDQVGRLDRAETVTNNIRELVPQSREAIVQNVYVGWARRQMLRIVRRQVEESLSEHGIGSGAGSNAGSLEPVTPGSGAVSPGSLAVTPDSVPETPGSTVYGSCLSETEAGEAASALGGMTDVSLDLEPIQETLELLGHRDEQGSCSST